MATLNRAVASRRRYRYIGNETWRGPGNENPPLLGDSLYLALDDCWEIEPEPEKLREWNLSKDPILDSIHCAGCSFRDPRETPIRVYDADAVDRLMVRR